MTVDAASGDTIVYITRTGECYHRAGCSSLKSKIETTLQQAVSDGYRACSKCNPPILTSEKTEKQSVINRSAIENSANKQIHVQEKNTIAANNAFKDVWAYVVSISCIWVFFEILAINIRRIKHRRNKGAFAIIGYLFIMLLCFAALIYVFVVALKSVSYAGIKNVFSVVGLTIIPVFMFFAWIIAEDPYEIGYEKGFDDGEEKQKRIKSGRAEAPPKDHN